MGFDKSCELNTLISRWLPLQVEIDCGSDTTTTRPNNKTAYLSKPIVAIRPVLPSQTTLAPLVPS